MSKIILLVRKLDLRKHCFILYRYDSLAQMAEEHPDLSVSDIKIDSEFLIPMRGVSSQSGAVIEAFLIIKPTVDIAGIMKVVGRIYSPCKLFEAE